MNSSIIRGNNVLPLCAPFTWRSKSLLQTLHKPHKLSLYRKTHTLIPIIWFAGATNEPVPLRFIYRFEFIVYWAVEEIFKDCLSLLIIFPFLSLFLKVLCPRRADRVERRHVLMGNCSEAMKMKKVCKFSSSSATQRLLGCFSSWAEVYEDVWLLTPTIDRTQLFF